MTKTEIKATMIETLNKAVPFEELPQFITALKAATLLKLMLGEITQETADTMFEGIKAFWGA